jgi:hypothetical protein
MNAEVLQLRVFKFSRPTAAVQMLQSHRRRDHFGVFLIGSFFLFYSIFKLFVLDAGLFFVVFLKYFGNGAGQAGLHSTFWVYSRPSCSCARVARQLRDCSSRNLILF